MNLGAWDIRRLRVDAPESARFAVIALIVWIAMTSAAGASHEMWRDEADAWLFARDGNFAQLTDWTRHAGTPALWYLILAPVARSGLPVESQQVLHLVVAAAAVAILFFRAPFSRSTKLLGAFGYFLGYEYSTIVRTYALSILLLFALAALHRKRPLLYACLLALLFNTNAQGFCIGAALVVVFVLHLRKPLPISIVALGALAAWWQVRAPADPMQAGSVRAFNPSAFPWTITNAFLPRVGTILGFLLGMAVLLALTLVLRRSREALLVLWLSIAAMGVIYSWIWIGGLRHAGFVLIAVLVAVWIGEGDSVPAALLLNLSLLVSVVVFAVSWRQDMLWPYSGAKEMAAFIRAQKLEQVPIGAHNLTQSEAVLAYLPPRRFWYAGLGRDGSYMTWDAAFERALDMPYPVAEQRAREHFAGQRWLLLFNVEMPDPAAHGFRLLHVTPPAFAYPDERFWLYQPADPALARGINSQS